MTRLIGHRLAHVSIALVCLTRAYAYSGILTPAIESPGPLFLTDEGRWLEAYALLWLVAGVIAMVDAVKPRTEWAVPAFIGLTTVWGLSYAGAWIVSDEESPDWLTAALYLGASGIILGAHVIITSLDREVASLAASLHAEVNRKGKETPGDVG